MGDGAHNPRCSPLVSQRGRDFLKRFVADLTTGIAHSETFRSDLPSLLIKANDPQTGRLSETEVRDNILTFVMAGHETTALL